MFGSQSLTPATLGVFVGGLSFGFAGFALPLFANAALVLVMPPQVVIPAVMLVSDTLALLLLWEHRNDLRRERLRTVPPFAPWALPSLLIGVALGGFLLGRVTPAVGRFALALVVFGFVAFQLLRRAPSGDERGAGDWKTAAGAALGGGLVDGWLGTGGVIIAIYLTWRRLAPGAFVASILVYFLTSDALRVLNYAGFGYWTRATFDLYVKTFPIAFAGYLGGVALRRVLSSPTVFRRVVLLLLTVYALALIRSALQPG
jgi:hypothetical protein